MNNWFTVKVKYTKQLENGTFKRVSEPYLLAAMTFTDAEARIYEELGSIIRGEFVVTNIARTDFHDIFYYEDSDIWFKCKISFESADGDGEKAKKVSQNFLVNARSVKEAFERLQESLSTMMVDFDIPSIMISPIVDIFPYTENLDKEISRTPIASIVDDFEEPIISTGKPVFSAPGSDLDDEDLEEEIDEEIDEDDVDSELEDDYSEK
jgi:type III secretion system FlhB-like substrate exporter